MRSQIENQSGNCTVPQGIIQSHEFITSGLPTVKVHLYNQGWQDSRPPLAMRRIQKKGIWFISGIFLDVNVESECVLSIRPTRSTIVYWP